MSNKLKDNARRPVHLITSLEHDRVRVEMEYESSGCLLK
jgi:hypothetical protein